MSAFSKSFGTACLVVALLGVFPAVAAAQLKDAQEKGWSVLKDGYGIVVAMRDNKGNRTRGNFETALGKLTSSMADMTTAIERMGGKVADEDRGYATGLRDNILGARRGVTDAHEKLRQAFEASKDNPDKLAEISNELTALVTALEQFETAAKAAYLNSKAKWDELQKEFEKLDAAAKAASDKIDAVNKVDDDLAKEEVSLSAELEKVHEDWRKLNKVSDEVEVLWFTTKRNRDQAYRDRNAQEIKRHSDKLLEVYDLQAKLIESRVATMKKLAAAQAAIDAKAQQRAANWREMKPAREQAAAVDEVALKLFGRFTLWDAEFPARTYSFQTLR